MTLEDLTPLGREALLKIGNKAVCAHDIGVGGGAMAHLAENGFATADKSRKPTRYSLTPRGHAAAQFLSRPLPVPAHQEGEIARIQRVTAEHFDIPLIEMVSARRSREVARPRQIAMYLAKELTPKSLPEIGRRFGGRDHTTIIHGIRQVARLIGEDVVLKRDVRAIREQVVSGIKSETVERTHFSAFEADCVSA